MNIDQRLEALTEKVEVLFKFQESHESNLNRLFELQAGNESLIRELGVKMERLEENQAKNQLTLAQVIEAIHDLARIAQSHERRLSDLEGQA